METRSRLKLNKSVAIGLSLVLGLAILLFVIMLLFNVTDYGITIASFGATIFMILSKKGAKKRTIFGSYFIAIILGFMFSALSDINSLNAGLAAISSIVLMTLLDLQHPPAVGISIAMVLNNFSFATDVIVLMCIFFIISVTMVLKAFLENPHKIMNFISMIEIEEEKINWKFQKREVPRYLRLKELKSGN